MSGVAGQAGLSFVVALALSLILMPLAVTLGAQLRMVVEPRLFRSSRSRRKVSYLGGPAVCLATVVGVLVARGLDRSTITILSGGLALFFVSYRDNKRRTRRWPPELVGCLQVTVATVIWWIEFRPDLPGFPGWLITIFLLVGSANAFNMLDNMNGVAGYTAAATAAGLIPLAFMSGNPALAVPVAALCGSVTGFLPYNHKRAKVYLGAGAPEFMGFILAASAWKASLYFGPRWAPVAALAILAVPATDSALVLLSRISAGRPVFKGAIDHISHRLFRMGFSIRRAARFHGIAALAAAGSVTVALAISPEVLLLTVALFALIGIGFGLIEGREPVRSRHSRPILRYGLYTVLGMVALSVPPILLAAWDFRGAKQAFAEGRQHAAAFNVAGAKEAFSVGGELFAKAESRLDWPLTLPARMLPVIGDNLQAARAMASSGRLLAPAAQEALEAAAVFPIGPAGPEIGFSNGRLNTQPWPAASRHLADGATGASLALADVRAADGVLLPPIKGARDQFVREGERAIKALEKASEAAALLPHFFADGTQRTWFLVLQNPVELRATGGFLGAFGILTAENGKLNLERFAANNDLPEVKSPVPAPEEFALNYDKFYSRTYWTSTNMTPDFPTAAGVQAAMYAQATGRHIDGVIAIDAVGLNRLLDVVGAIDVEDIGEVTSENFLPLALNEAYLRFPDKDDRANFLLPVGEEVWSRLVSGNFLNPRSLMVPLGELVATKRIQMWSPGELDRLKRLGLAGELRPTEDADYLMVVGQNAAGNKVDYYAHRRVRYRVDLTNPRSVKGVVDVQISNGAPADAKPGYIMGPILPNDFPGLNRTFTSVYMPMSTFVTEGMVNGSPSGVESKNELGLAVASRFLEIPPQSDGTFTIRTQSSLARPGRYKLVIQHQPNLNPDRMDLDITLPKGAFVYNASPGLRVVGNHVRWSGELNREMEFEVRYGTSYGDRTNGVLASD